MKRRAWLNSSGFTMIEMILTAILTGALVLTVVLVLAKTSASEQSGNDVVLAQEQVLEAVNLILSYGRLSSRVTPNPVPPVLPNTCTRPCVRAVPAGQNCQLECAFLFPDGAGNVAFLNDPANGRVLVDIQRGAGAWTTQSRFPQQQFRSTHTMNLRVWNDAEMTAGPRDQLDVLYAASLVAAAPETTLPNRFYRFQVTATTIATGVVRTLQSAFFARNPLVGFSNPSSVGGIVTITRGK